MSKIEFYNIYHFFCVFLQCCCEGDNGGEIALCGMAIL